MDQNRNSGQAITRCCGAFDCSFPATSNLPIQSQKPRDVSKRGTITYLGIQKRMRKTKKDLEPDPSTTRTEHEGRMVRPSQRYSFHCFHFAGSTSTNCNQATGKLTRDKKVHDFYAIFSPTNHRLIGRTFTHAAKAL